MPALGRSFVMGPVAVRTIATASIRALFVAAKEEERELQKRTVDAWMQLQMKGKELEQKPTEVSS